MPSKSRKKSRDESSDESDDFGDADGDGATDSLDFCNSMLVCALVVTTIAGTALSIATLPSCDFLTYTLIPGNNSTIEGVPWATTSFSNATRASFGLVYFQYENQTCAIYSHPDRMGATYQTGRYGGIIAACLGVVSIAVLAIELVCCRFRCSRVVLVSLLALAVLGQSLTFVLYASDVCFSNKNLAGYPCSFGGGSILSVVAFGLYMCACTIACPAPKPRPLIMMILERRSRQRRADPCCYCWHKKSDKDASNKEKSVNGRVKEVTDQSVFDATNQPPPPIPPYRNSNYFPEDEMYAPRRTSSYIASSMPDPDDTISGRITPCYYPNNDPAMMGGRYDTQPPYSYYQQQQQPQFQQQQPYYRQQTPDYSTDSRYNYAPTQPQQPPLPPRPPPPQQLSSFVNAEVVQDDLFFDTKTV